MNRTSSDKEGRGQLCECTTAIHASHKLVKKAKRGSSTCTVFSLAIVILVPFFWMLSTALQEEGNIFAWPPQWIPDPPQWNNFPDAWNALPFNLYLGNTIFIVALGIIAELASATLVAYGFARFRFPGSDFVFLVCWRR